MRSPSNPNKEPTKPQINTTDKPNIEKANMKIDAHLVIKDNDTNKIILNTRG